MTNMPLKKQEFPFKLASWLPTCYTIYLIWLRHLLERLGQDRTLSIWRDVRQDYDDGFLLQILGTGWNIDMQAKGGEAEQKIAALFSGYFPDPIQGVSKISARQLVEEMPPVKQIKQTFQSLSVWKSMTAYEALHLKFDARALLAESLIRLHGKQGELIAYDVLREERRITGGGRTGSVAEFISDFISEPETPNLFTAGLRVEWVQVSELEVVLNVKECEWARYFQERHPQVGYLLACSTDEVAYRAFNKDIRMQRTATLMEGGEVCDFRIYTVSDNHEGQ